MKNSPVKYFDLTTQECFDIFSHFKFIEPFKGVIIGPTEEAILFQYRQGTGSPSPGFRFLLRTVPGAVYCVVVEGFLHKGDTAIFFIESIQPNLKIVPKEYSFKNQIKQKFSLNFRAVANLTTIGILFDSDKLDYCLAITDLKVRKLDECLLPVCGEEECISENPCPSPCPCIEPPHPACCIGGPPTISELCPKTPKVNCTGKSKIKIKPDNRKEVDFCGTVVESVSVTACKELGELILESTTCRLWICDGQQFIPFQSQKDDFLFLDKKCNEIWRVNSETCYKLCLRG